MIIFDGENTVAFDIDQTLFIHDFYNKHPQTTHVINPYTNELVWGREHFQHIDLLKQYKGRGLTVIVWSAAGVKWAEAVIKAYNLENYVDLIMTKPNKLVDDLTPNEIFPCRIFLHE